MTTNKLLYNALIYKYNYLFTYQPDVSMLLWSFIVFIKCILIVLHKPENRKSRSRPLQHKFIAATIQDQFFVRASRNAAKAIGVLYPEVFKPISVQLIAFIYALVSI